MWCKDLEPVQHVVVSSTSGVAGESSGSASPPEAGIATGQGSCRAAWSRCGRPARMQAPVRWNAHDHSYVFAAHHKTRAHPTGRAALQEHLWPEPATPRPQTGRGDGQADNGDDGA